MLTAATACLSVHLAAKREAVPAEPLECIELRVVSLPGDCLDDPPDMD